MRRVKPLQREDAQRDPYQQHNAIQNRTGIAKLQPE
jgi:hypothetical protein